MQAALKGAVSLCKRHSRDAAPAAAQELWFSVLQRYVALLRRLRQLARQPSAGPVPPKQAQRLAAAQVMHPRRVMRLQVWRPFYETNADHLRLLQVWLGACGAQDRATVARISSQSLDTWQESRAESRNGVRQLPVSEPGCGFFLMLPLMLCRRP